jgi:hypothetical protein
MRVFCGAVCLCGKDQAAVEVLPACGDAHGLFAVQLSSGLECVLQGAAAKGQPSGSSCVAQVCQSTATRDILALFLLGLALHLLALLELCRVWRALARGLHRAWCPLWQVSVCYSWAMAFHSSGELLALAVSGA